MKRTRFFLCASLMVFVPQILAAGNAEHGEVLYQVYCTQCHGVTGTGSGINVRDMAVQPRDHTDTNEMSARTDADLIKAIKHGGKAVDKSVLMPAWERNLNDKQVDDIVAYLRQLCCED